MKVMMICLAALFCGSIANAQTAGSQCELAESTKLFKAKTGKKYSSKLSKATKVVLEVLDQDRWQVKTSAGDLGYINVRRLKNICKWTAPSQDTGSVAENMAALDVSKTLAEKPTPGLEPLAHSQAKVIQQAQDAWEFKTCQRSNGTTYGTAGDCAQKGSKEVKK